MKSYASDWVQIINQHKSYLFNYLYFNQHYLKQLSNKTIMWNSLSLQKPLMALFLLCLFPLGTLAQSIVKGTVNDEAGDPIIGATVKVRGTQTAFEEGHSIWHLDGYIYDGLDANGNPIIRDLNGDGNISTEDQTDIGRTTPSYTYGINITAAYKGFDLLINGYGQGGNYIIPVLHDTGYKNGLKYYLEEGGKSIPSPEKIVRSDEPFWSSTGNRFKGDYFRIKQLQLGYTIPTNITKKAYISNFRVYVSLDDFFTITSYPGLDPETASTNNTTGAGLDWGSYPTMKKLVLGVNVTF